MIENVILIRYGELYLKGNNRGFFEKLAMQNIKTSLKGYDFLLNKIDGRYIVSNYALANETILINKIKKVFGLHSISPSVCLNTSEDEILNYLKTLKIDAKTFKVAVRRADKTFPIGSLDFSAICGGAILDNNKDLTVDIHNPETEITVDIRANKKTYINSTKIMCSGGLPVGSSGTGLSLLSGGIDSPVSSFLMAKRGMKIDFLHFFSYPYTSEQAKDKVITLAKIVKEYSLSHNLYMINFAKAQEEIHKNCNGDYMILIMRRIMMQISTKLCAKYKYQAIITGENLGQVASQTIENITLTNLTAEEIPVLRPLIGFDKDDIVKIAENIGTFKTSILPYEDCCTVFLPKNPIIKGNLKNLLKEESKLDINKIVDDCINSIELITLN